MLRFVLLLIVSMFVPLELGGHATPPAVIQVETPAKTDVYVLASLYRRHDETPSYDLAALRRTVLAVQPDVLIVDCTPTEVRERRVSPGKIEYPGVIFPLADDRRWPMYAAEPDEPLFSEIVEGGAAARQTAAAAQPAVVAALKAYESSMYTVLAQHWQSPAAVHDDVTVAVLEGLNALEARYYGDAQIRWDRHWTDMIVQAVDENSGKRLLAITGVKNRPWIVRALREDPRVNLIDMPAWLRSQAGVAGREIPR